MVGLDNFNPHAMFVIAFLTSTLWRFLAEVLRTVRQTWICALKARSLVYSLSFVIFFVSCSGQSVTFLLCREHLMLVWLKYSILLIVKWNGRL